MIPHANNLVSAVALSRIIITPSFTNYSIKNTFFYKGYRQIMPVNKYSFKGASQKVQHRKFVKLNSPHYNLT